MNNSTRAALIVGGAIALATIWISSNSTTTVTSTNTLETIEATPEALASANPKRVQKIRPRIPDNIDDGDDPVAACVGTWIATSSDGSRSIQFQINGDYQATGGTYTLTEDGKTFSGNYDSPADRDNVLAFDDGDDSTANFVMGCAKPDIALNGPDRSVQWELKRAR